MNVFQNGMPASKRLFQTKFDRRDQGFETQDEQLGQLLINS